MHPGVLLFDEPLSNLDAKLRVHMRDEIRKIQKEVGITTIYVTHDQKEALSMADRCAILRQGRVEQIGSPRDLYERPANCFVADFIGGANLVPGKVRAVTNGFATITTAFGEWTAREQAHAFQPGTAVTLAIRPEALRLRASSGTDFNHFAGHLTENIYLGEATESWIRMSDGFVIKALASGPARLVAPTVETPFHVNPDNVIMLATE